MRDVQMYRQLIPQLCKTGRYEKALLSIIIPVYEPTANLARTIWSIKQTIDVPCQVIVQIEKQSVAKNRNAGLEKATGEVIAFVDDDVILPPHWTSQLLAFLDKYEDCGVVAPRMTGPAGEPQNNLSKVLPGTYLKCRPPGTLFMYDRERVGDCKFDEEYVASQWEDTDFMRQVEAKGLRCYCMGDVWILHEMNLTQANQEVWDKNKAHYQSKWERETADV